MPSGSGGLPQKPTTNGRYTMKLHEFYEATIGTDRLLSISEMEEPASGHDFWAKYSGKPEWQSEIQSINIIPIRRDNWCDTVICLITLK
jgi:hypothetical protein